MSYGHTPRRATARARTSGEGRWQRRGMLLIGLLALGMLAALVAGASAEVPIKLLPLALDPPQLHDRVYVVTESVDRAWNATALLTALDSGGGPPAYTIANVGDAQISLDGAQLFVAYEQELRSHDAATGALRWAQSFDAPPGDERPAKFQTLIPGADGRGLFAVAYTRESEIPRLYEIDPDSGDIVGEPIELGPGSQSRQWLAAPGGGRLYEVSESGYILVIDLALRQIAARINLTQAALGAAISADGAAMYVLASSFEIVEIDLRANRIAATRSLGVQPERTRLGGLWLLPGAPDRLLVGTYNLSRAPFAELREYDLADLRELRRVTSDRPLAWDQLALGTAGRQVFAATDGGLRDDNTIRAFDLRGGESRLLLDEPMPPVRRVLAGPPFVRRLPPPAPSLGELPATPQQASPLAGPADGAPLAYVLQYHPELPTSQMLAVGPGGQVETLGDGMLTMLYRKDKPPLLSSAPTTATVVIRDPLAGASPPLTITVPPHTALGQGVLSPDEQTVAWDAERDEAPADGRRGESFLLLADLRSGATRQVALPQSVADAPAAAMRVWSADGLLLVTEAAAMTAVYQGDPRADPPAWRLAAQFDGRLLDYRADAGVALLSHRRDDGYEIELRDLASGGGTLLMKSVEQTIEGMIPGAGRVGVSPDGRKVALLRTKDNGRIDLYVHDVASGAGEVWAADLDVNEFGGWLNWGGGRLAVSINLRGRDSRQHQQILLYDGESGELIDKLMNSQFGAFSLNERGQVFLARPGAKPSEPSVLEIYQIGAPNVAPAEVTLKPGYVGFIHAP